MFGIRKNDHVKSERCYKWTILQRIYRKMTVLLQNSIVNEFGSHNTTILYDPNPVYNEVCVINGLNFI